MAEVSVQHIAICALAVILLLSLVRLRFCPRVKIQEAFVTLDKHNSPYYKRSWPSCNPSGINFNCKTQGYIDPETSGPQKIHSEGYHNFPRDTESCSPSCATSDPRCSQNPYGQNYQDPRWLNARFWNKQEQLPGLPGGNWYPNQTILS